MKQINQFKNKQVVVIGFARTGYQVAKLLVKLGANVTINDKNTNAPESDVAELQSLGVNVILGYHPDDLMHTGVDYVVKNPGIPYRIDIIQKAIALNIPILTDVEIAYLVSDAPIIAITGSNGKTTTTTLIANMLENLPSGGKSYLAGNIGIPSTAVAQKVQENDQIIMELSSFQLMGIDQFRSEIALFVNIHEAHIDYHGSREAYVSAKLNLLKNQKDTDIAIFNGDISESQSFAKMAKGKVYYFSKYDETAAAYIKNGEIIVFSEVVASVEDIQVPGEHNLENVLAAILVAKLKGQSNAEIVKGLHAFHGVKHRTQFVKTVQGRKFYNDSKATNILATQMALNGFTKPVILIAGGLDRGNDFITLEPSLKRVKTIVLYGESKYKLEQSAKNANVNHIIVVNHLDEAVEQAFDDSQEGDTILFSPACASWDQFDSFETRGDRFIELVESL